MFSFFFLLLIKKQQQAVRKVKVRSVPALRLWYANGVAAVFHLTLFLMITIIGSNGQAPYTVFFDTFWANFAIPENIKDPFCCLLPPNECGNISAPDYGTLVGNDAPDCQCRTYVKGEFNEWMQCENLYNSEWQEANWDHERLYTPAIKNVWKMKTWVLLSAFELMTFLMHSFLFWRHEMYIGLIEKKLQPFRWLEYSATSSIMLVAVASLSSITDVHLLVYMFLVQSYINLTGGWLYELCSVLESCVRLDRSVRSYVRYTKWAFFLFAWVGFVLEFVTIFGAFYDVLNPYFDLESGELWKEVFFFVEIANWALFLSYLSFPLIHIYQIAVPYLLTRPSFNGQKKWQWFINDNFYYNAELGYIIASFFSKGILTSVVFYAAVMRDDDQEEKVMN